MLLQRGADFESIVNGSSGTSASFCRCGDSTWCGADGLRTLAASYKTRVVEICPQTSQGARFCESFHVGGLPSIAVGFGIA